MLQRVASVFNDNGNGIRGDMAAVVKAIYMDDEARSGVASSGEVFGKIKEPLIRLTALWRAFDAYAINGEYDFRSSDQDLVQAPLGAPSVFNFFSPFYSPKGDIYNNDWVLPEMEVHTEGTMSKMVNQLYWRTIGLNNYDRIDPAENEILIHIDREKALAEVSDQELIQHLNILLLHGNMTDFLELALVDLLSEISEEKPEEKASEAIGLIITSPEFSVQQ